MPALLAGALAVAALVVLLAVLAPTRRSARRFQRTTSVVVRQLDNRSGLLRARRGALGVAIRQRRRVRIEGDPARVPSGEPAQTGGRP
ncbi:bacteriophage holin [Actinophytocola sp.]|uniref:bacteriophage holin n=1 Tax=Actinophytocola sp. TaxID=1872138 RepID=UPI002D802F75|nr:bacteriophage holin [Actinophytocola sp.]HET9140480.1 bacteriophage holin [Actinophytocola sp.]